ncbi:sensor histidine kinase [Leucobacter sp. wl10]|uniref:sensor histidine kinase n=1 Tax=Leucobacter sp. wl10 TaxID=2304677 RepID=UPI0013C2FAAC|nr:sensor histidine kinase [Leucobacter sp. wl10]
MVNTSPAATRRTPLFDPAQLARDYAYVMPGFVISLFAFVVLVPLTALSIGTLIIWVGALLLPLTLVIASGFAQLSRTRLRLWGRELPAVRYAPPSSGFPGLLQRMTEPRRWLDLAFETVVAFPLRTFTFVVAVTWTAGAAGGLTFPIWGVFLPQDDPPLAGRILEAITDGSAPDAVSRSFLLDAGFNVVCGAILLLTLPMVMRGLALLDAATTSAALGGPDAERGIPGSAGSPAPEPAAASAAPAGGAGRPADGLARFASGEGWVWIAAVLTAVVSIAVGWPVLAVLLEVPVVFAMCVTLASATALLIAIRWPMTGVALQTIAAVATALLSFGAPDPFWPWPWPVMTLILQAVLVLLVALRNPWPRAVAAWALPQAGVLAVALAIGLTPGAWSSVIVSSSVSLGVLAIGIAVRQLLTSRGALREEQRTSAELAGQRSELAERNRIARELHDVVAHSMSVISVQATTAKYRLPGMDPDAAGEFESIAASSRQALAEMRGLLGVLRSPDRRAELAPQPGLADIPALIEATRRSGALIVFRSEVDGAEAPSNAGSVPAATALTVYRIVQEALSNAVRHSPGAEIEVAVTVTGDRVAVDVVNGPPVGSDPPQAAPGAGLGLSGVRERTAALGGAVDAGRTESGGFRVHARLPLG